MKWPLQWELKMGVPCFCFLDVLINLPMYINCACSLEHCAVQRCPEKLSVWAFSSSSVPWVQSFYKTDWLTDEFWNKLRQLPSQSAPTILVLKKWVDLWPCLKVSTTPIMTWGASNVYVLVMSSWKVKIAQNPIFVFVMGL